MTEELPGAVATLLRKHEVVTAVHVHTVDEARALSELMLAWITIRGQSSLRHGLASSLERSSVDRSTCVAIEAESIRRIKSESAVPGVTRYTSDHRYWPGLARHYGLAMRLVDFPRSLPVAVLLGTRRAMANEPTVWAVD